jgi:carboxypeptidase Q
MAAMRLATSCILVVLLSVVATASGPDDASRLAERVRGGSRIPTDLGALCDRIGGRPTMSPYCRRAIEWAAEAFRATGVDSVALEPFAMPVNWLPDDGTGWCTYPEEFAVPIASVPLSPSTPGEHAVETSVVVVSLASPELSRTPARNAIVLAMADEIAREADLTSERDALAALTAAAARAGAAAVLVQSSRPRGLLYRPLVPAGARVAPLPVAMVSREHASRLARLARSSDVRMRLRIDNTFGPPAESRNVVAEIRGRERPGEVVLVGAHLDSWDLGTGANDNGVNCALVVDLARAIKDLGLAPRRTIRFVLFTGSEEGGVGSAAYVARHDAELDDHVAVLILDGGSGRVSGFTTSGSAELGDAIDLAIADAGLARLMYARARDVSGDAVAFRDAGVPTADAVQKLGLTLMDHHAESDTLDKVDLASARDNAAVVAVTVWGLATRRERPVARRAPAR